MLEKTYAYFCDYCGRREPVPAEGELPPGWKACGPLLPGQATMHFCSGHLHAWNERAERERISQAVGRMID